MTGEQFVKLCHEEKEAMLSRYFEDSAETLVGDKIKALYKKDVSKKELSELINSVLEESFYTLLMGIEGEASLGGVQNAYKLYDEEGNLLNEFGEIEAAAFEYFMEK